MFTMKFLSNFLIVVSFMSSVFTLTDAAIQMDPVEYSYGSIYSAAMVVGPGNIIYYTGVAYHPATTKPHCFLATSSFELSSFLDWRVYTEQTTLGSSCRSIALIGTDQLTVVGNTDPHGNMNYASQDHQFDFPLPGFAMTVTTDLRPIKGVALSSFSGIPYPQAIVGDLQDSTAFFVASMTTNQYTDNTSQGGTFPDWTHLLQYGSAFTVQNFFSQDDIFASAWTQYFDVEPKVDGVYDETTTVQVGGMINKAGVGLIVAGSTAGVGEAYGRGSGDDVDGFVAILDPLLGNLYNADTSGSARTTQRFGSDVFDAVTNICDDPSDKDAFYIVGATMGDMNGYVAKDIIGPPQGSMVAFIRRVFASSLQEDWTVQLGSYIDGYNVSSTEALACVANSEGSVYVVGQVEDGAGIIERNKIHASMGERDIWIARIDIELGERKWIQQVGTKGHDTLARNAPIVLDLEGNAVVYGNTNGNLYRERGLNDVHDLFVMKFAEEDGYFLPTVSGDEMGMTITIVELPEDKPIEESPVKDEEKKLEKKGGGSAGRTIGIVFGVLFALGILIFFILRRMDELDKASYLYDGLTDFDFDYDPKTGRGVGVFHVRVSPEMKMSIRRPYFSEDESEGDYRGGDMGNFHRSYDTTTEEEEKR